MKTTLRFKLPLLTYISIAISLFLSCEKEQTLLSETSEETINAEPKNFSLETTNSNGAVVSIAYNKERIWVERIEDHYLLEGDILIKTDGTYPNTNRAAKSVGRTSGRWENNSVYYTIDSNLPASYRVIDAIAHWESKTNIRFKPKTATIQDYITFRVGSGCSSYVGKIGGQQFINLSLACSTGNVIHEIGHTIGLWHEQSRKDRDDYITIHYENIKSGKAHNFQTYEQQFRDGDEYTNTFDFGSIMMYNYTAFSTNGQPTITKKDGSIFFAQRDGLSEGDISGVDKMYPPVIGSTINSILPVIKNPSFSIKDVYKNGSTHTCSCTEWYNPNFLNAPFSSTDSNDDPGNQGGGSIKLTNTVGNQKVAYQLLEAVTPGITYKLKFYYAIKNAGTLGALDFRILTPAANTPATVTDRNTVAQFIGQQTAYTNTIKESKGGGQVVELEFTPTTNQVALYAVNSVINGSDVRIDNFTIEFAQQPTAILPEIKNATFSNKALPYDGAPFSCSCVSWYNPDFMYAPSSSADSNDDPGTQGGGSIKLTNTVGTQKVAYQLLDKVTPGTTYKLKFYYAIKNIGTLGALDFRVLTPAASNPSLVTQNTTVAQFIGQQTGYTNSIKGSKGGGQVVEFEFTPTTDQVALYAVNSVVNGSDVRIDNFTIEFAQ